MVAMVVVSRWRSVRCFVCATKSCAEADGTVEVFSAQANLFAQCLCCLVFYEVCK